MDPQQELFTKIRELLFQNERGYYVYDSALPPEGTAYPFLYIGNSQLYDELNNKTQVVGRVYQTIHVWSNKPQQRGEVSRILLEAKEMLRGLTKTTNFSWAIQSISQQILPDNSTKEPLLHGILDVEYRFD